MDDEESSAEIPPLPLPVLIYPSSRAEPNPSTINNQPLATPQSRQSRLSHDLNTNIVQEYNQDASALVSLYTDAPWTIQNRPTTTLATFDERQHERSGLHSRPELEWLDSQHGSSTKLQSWASVKQTASQFPDNISKLSIEEHSPYGSFDQKYEECVPNSRFCANMSRFRSRHYPRDYCNDVTTYRGRLATFFDWGDRIIDKKILAEAGFFYKGSNDEVHCFKCHGTLRQWEQGDDPREQHKENFGFHCL